MKEESLTLEYKKSLAQLKEGVISLSSMLNKSHKGELYFGITPDYKPFKFTITKQTLMNIANEVRFNLKPYPNTFDIDVVKYEGVDVIRIRVEGSETPYCAYGRYYLRSDESDVPMTNSQLQQLFIEKEDNYSKWEEKPTNYTVDDIDEDLLIEVIRTANDKGRLSYVYKNVKDALTKLDLIDENGNIKMAGYYLFGKGKPITFKEAIYPTDSRVEFGEIKQFKGNIFECIKEAYSYITNHISYKANIVGFQRYEQPEIPLIAIREILINSFAHSKYEVKEDTNQIIIFKSSIRIYNPGSIYKNINPKRFAKAEVGSKIRNILIASVLYKCGYIEAFGTGFERTFSLCKEYDVDYKYINDEFGFTFIFKRNPDFLKNSVKAEHNVNLDKLDKKLLDQISKRRELTIPELSKITGYSEATVYRHLTRMSVEAIIKREGARKNGFWEILYDHWR